MNALQFDDTINIQTPEGIQFSLNLAGPTTRFVAWLIDCFVVSVFTFLLSSLYSMVFAFSADLSGAATLLTFFVLNIGYGIALEWLWKGKTLGKYLMNLQVVDLEGVPVAFNQIALRNLLRAIDAMPLLYLVGGVTMLFNRRNQRLGDLAANTLVIRNRHERSPRWEQVVSNRYNSLRDYPHLVARLRQRSNHRVAALAVEALLRKDSLDAAAQTQLYRELAHYFRELAPFPEEATATLSDEQYLRNVMACLYQDRLSTAPDASHTNRE